MLQGHNREQLTPMVLQGGHSFFVDEIAQLHDNSYFIAEMFVKRHGELWARGHQLEALPMVSLFNEVSMPTSLNKPQPSPGNFRLQEESILRPVTAFQHNCVRLEELHPNGIRVLSGMYACVMDRSPCSC
jgi:hypothetical protein